MAQTTFRVTLSLDGKHSVAVSGEDPTAVQDALAWARGIYLKLQTFSDERGIQPEGEPPSCEVHGVPMTWQKGRKGYFWSCHERMPDDSWCS